MWCTGESMRETGGDAAGSGMAECVKECEEADTVGMAAGLCMREEGKKGVLARRSAGCAIAWDEAAPMKVITQTGREREGAGGTNDRVLESDDGRSSASVRIASGQRRAPL